MEHEFFSGQRLERQVVDIAGRAKRAGDDGRWEDVRVLEENILERIVRFNFRPGAIEGLDADLAGVGRAPPW